MEGGGGLGGLRWTAEEASTIGGIATVSLLHSFIPTHWLPFSIVARAQRWPLSRTLLVNTYTRNQIGTSTITVMTSLVALSFYGASQIKFHWVERYDKILVGTVLCLVGILTYVFHHHDGDEHSLHEHVYWKLVSP
nr:unnamed protein product [Digitaria exilis]